MATNIGTGPQDIPLNQFLGQMAFMDDVPKKPSFQAVKNTSNHNFTANTRTTIAGWVENHDDGGMFNATSGVITISAPGSSGSGNYSFNETVTGSVSGATARVRTWDASTNEIEIYNISGTFKTSETLTGSSSGAAHLIRLIDLTNFDDGFGENDEFEIQADAILDFSEGNPFGTP